MDARIFATSDLANEAAAGLLALRLVQPGTRTLMVASGNTPLDLYRRIGERQLPLDQLHVFALDEYVGVPPDHRRTCANILRRTLADTWKISAAQFHGVSSLEDQALASIQEHERKIAAHGGLDLVILGLGQNGHLGFNEPGSAPDSVGRLIDLEPISIEANRQWFHGEYAPVRGVTVGLKTILSAKTVLLLAYGAHKTASVSAMIEGPQTSACPASWLQTHPGVVVFLDEPAASRLKKKS